jgi:hypothetical protein
MVSTIHLMVIWGMVFSYPHKWDLYGFMPKPMGKPMSV